MFLVACGGGGEKATPTKRPAASPTPTASGPLGRGADLFAQNCSPCHGPDAEGLPRLGKNLRTSAFVRGLSDTDLLDFINTGRSADDPVNTTKVDMPPKGANESLTDDQLKLIIAYIRSVQK